MKITVSQDGAQFYVWNCRADYDVEKLPCAILTYPGEVRDGSVGDATAARIWLRRFVEDKGYNPTFV